MISRRKYRGKRLLSLLLSLSMGLTFNVTPFAADLYSVEEENVFSQNSSENIETLDSYDTDFDQTDIEMSRSYFQSEDKENSASGKGWIFEASDSTSVDAVFTEPSDTDSNTKSTINLINPEMFGKKTERSDTVYFCYTPGLEVKFSGTLSSGSLKIEMGSFTDEEKEYHYIMNENKITISVRKDNLVKDEDSGTSYIDIMVQTSVKKGGAKQTTIDSKNVSFELENGLTLVKERTYSKDNKSYIVWRVEDDGMALNYPAASVNTVIGDYTVTYYTKIPSKTSFKAEKIFASVLDNNTGKTYSVTDYKIVRLKNVEPNQGPFPTISNAGIQIKKLEPSSSGASKADFKAAKKVQRKLKRLTKVAKKRGWDSQSLPIIIYPKRLTNEYVKYKKNYFNQGKLSGRSGKYRLYFDRCSIQNGKKDSFGTGVHQVDFDRTKGIITVNSADCWTGPDGLSINYVRDLTHGR